MHEQVHCCDEAANHQSPIAAAFFVIFHFSLTKNIEVVLPNNCFAWRGVLAMDNTFPIKNTVNMVLILL